MLLLKQLCLVLTFAAATAAALGSSKDPVEIFAHFLRFKTVSSEDTAGHVLLPQEFAAAHQFLESTFPNVFSQLAVEKVANFSLLFKWEGSDSGALPIALLSHQDVVPAEEGPDSPWTKPPFGGVIEDGWVYGRGAMDTKFSLVAILQAAEDLLAEGFKPSTSFYFCFGHDEEVGGDAGAVHIAKLLAEQGVKLDFVLDEGGFISTDGLPPLTKAPVALVSTAEKGFVSVDVKVHAQGGHSSRPPIDKSSVLEIMGRILTHVSDEQPPLRLAEPVPSMLQALAPAASSSFYSYLFRHCTSKLVEPVVRRLLARWTPSTAALVRTTVAATIARSGLQDNVLPETGSLVFNFRTLPGEEQLFPEEYLWDKIGDDKPRVDVKPRSEWSLPPTAPASGAAWDHIAAAINATFTQYQDLLVVPNLLSGATDSRHYSSLSRQGLYRFSGISSSSSEGERVHGIDERIKAKDYLLGVDFFKEIIRQAGSKQPGSVY